MAAATILEVQQRIIDLCKLIVLPSPLGTTDALNSEDDCTFEASDLPVFIVRRGPGVAHSYPDTSSRVSAREYFMRLFVLKICDDGSADANKETALALAASCIEPVLDFFTPRPGLTNNIDGADGIVNQARILQDSGDSTVFSAQSDTFSGVLFRMQVITRHHAEGATLW